MLKALFFDLFGTVVAYGDVVRGTRLAWEGIYDVAVGLGLAASFDAFASEWQRQFTMPLAKDEHIAKTVFLSKMLRMFASYGLPQDHSAAQVAVDACLEGWDKPTYVPDDVLLSLRVLRERYHLGLVSNFDHPPYAHGLLRRTGLGPLFHSIVVSGDILIDKPDRRIFQHAMACADALPGESLFVGDNLRTDIEGAQSAGMRAILIDRRDRHPDYAGERIAAIRDLLSLL